MKKTAIIILTYNNLTYNKGVLKSIRKYTKEGTYEVIMVDNMSTDGTREWLGEQTDIKVILNDENTGFPRGCNIGIAAAERDSDILLLNNDIEVCHNWLDNLQTALYSHPEIGCVGGIDANYFIGALNEQGEAIDFNAQDTSEIHEFAIKNNISDSKRWKYVNFLLGYCMLFKRDVLDQIGGLDERFSPGNFEDDDIAFRVLEAGYYLLQCYDCFIHHFGSQSFRKDETKYWKLLDINSKKFSDKWEFNAGDKIHNQNYLLNVLEADVNKPINVLHIGCGLGMTLFEIKNRYPLANLYGIETNENYAKVMKGILKISTKPATQFPLEFEEKLFDFILVGETFEQSENPRNFLTSMKNYLKSDGHLIVGIQNVMHYNVLKKVLNGHWYYGKQTALNKDNRIFLTADDIKILSNECGYMNPFIFHWFLESSKEDDEFIKKLCAITSKDKEHLYRTSQYIARFQNNHFFEERKKIKLEATYLLRRIENAIEPKENLSMLKNYLDSGWLTLGELEEIVDQGTINKDLIHFVIDNINNIKEITF